MMICFHIAKCETLLRRFLVKSCQPLWKALERLLVLDRFNDLYEQVRKNVGEDRFVEGFLETMNVRPRVSSDRLLVPKRGPVVVVANHPFGIIEGAILYSLLAAIRPDVKIMANHLLASLPEARRYCIFVNPFGGHDAVRANQSRLKDSIAWLNQGGLLAVFPAGEVAHLKLRERSVSDPEWNRSIARLIRLTGATVVPVYFLGANSVAFQLLGLLHARVRTALLAHELLNKNNRDIELRIGSPITPTKIKHYQDDLALIRYLRHRTYLLHNRDTTPRPPRAEVHSPGPSSIGRLMSSEIAKLPNGQTLLETEDFLVLLAKAPQIPNVLHEVGRLREITFRQVGEGTGRAIDLDTFDDHYWHLFLWNKSDSTSRGRLSPRSIGRDRQEFGRRGSLYQAVVCMETVVPRTHRPGARAWPFLRSLRVSKNVRATAAFVARHRPIPCTKSSLQSALRPC
jgi:putative hemolysin